MWNVVCAFCTLCIVPLLRQWLFYSCEQFKDLKRWRMHVIHVIGLCQEWERTREFRIERKNGMCLWCCAISIEALIRFLRRKEPNEKPSSGMLSSFVQPMLITEKYQCIVLTFESKWSLRPTSIEGQNVTSNLQVSLKQVIERNLYLLKSWNIT